MRNVIFPVQDVALYGSPSLQQLNTGQDEILECGHYTPDGTNGPIRSLVQFNLNALSASLVSGSIPLNAQYDFTLYIAEASQLINGQTLQLQLVSQSWVEGDGFFWEQVTGSLIGATWEQSNSSSLWLSYSASISGASPGGATQSLAAGVLITQSFNNPITDVTINVTEYVNYWLSGTYPNFGMLVQFPVADEQASTNQGNVKFFSRQTHTIYQPTLTIKWNDQLISTGSLTASPQIDLFVAPSGLRPRYRQNEIARVDLAVRPRNPLKTFNTVFANYAAGQYYLPSSSYYSIIDEAAGTTLVPFDSYSLVSCSPSGAYFNFTVTPNLFPLRTYRVLIRVDHDGISEIFDNNNLFDVVF